MLVCLERLFLQVACTHTHHKPHQWNAKYPVEMKHTSIFLRLTQSVFHNLECTLSLTLSNVSSVFRSNRWITGDSVKAYNSSPKGYTEIIALSDMDSPGVNTAETLRAKRIKRSSLFLLVFTLFNGAYDLRRWRNIERQTKLLWTLKLWRM